MDKTAPTSLLSVQTLRYVQMPPKKCRTLNEFDVLNVVGEGTYGIVYRALDRESGEIVALKKVRMNDLSEDGFPQTSVQEISILLNIEHENVVRLKEVVEDKADNVFLVMEFCEQDLASLLDNMPKPFDCSQLKCILLQLLSALSFLHDRFIVHRDVKMSNLLMKDDGRVKLGDFGMTRVFGVPEEQMSPGVVTLWYRSPEVLVTSSVYGTGVDVWAAGCIFGELILHQPLLPGKCESEQIKLIVDLLGTPTKLIWQDIDELLSLKKLILPQQPYNNLKHRFNNRISCAGLALLNAFLIYDPSKRISAGDALTSSYFKESPLPCSPNLMPSFKQYRNL